MVSLCTSGEPLREALFEARINRFVVHVRLDGKSVAAHLPNSGRLRELLTEGRHVYVRPVASDRRKTGYDLALVDYGGILVSVDSRLPNSLVEEAVREARLSAFDDYGQVRREVRWITVRLDLELKGQGRECLVEAKSVTLVRDGVARFPDAPTLRGRRHLEALRQAVEQGKRGAIVFVVQRGDAQAFAPNDETDSGFGEALRSAACAGVEVYAYGCRVTTREIRIDRRVAIQLGAQSE